MSMIRVIALLCRLALPAVLTGCGIGYNSMVFSTKTNAGLDIDSSPPTAQISISRSEAVFAPAFEGAKTLPVMASFRFENEGLFASHLGSAFAAGDAAVAMTTLWDDTRDSTDASAFDGTLELTARPQPPGHDRQLYAPGEVRPLIFGTDTSLGLKMAWSGLTSGAPDTLRLGFNRKELAWSPVTYADSRLNPDGTTRQGHFVSVPSLLATIDTRVETAEPSGSELRYVQYFATGDAATQLAMKSDVRKAMKPRFDPGVIVGGGHVIPGSEGSVDRLRAFIRDQSNRSRLRAWLDARGIRESVTFVVNDKSMDAVRRDAVADPELNVPPPLPAPANP